MQILYALSNKLFDLGIVVEFNPDPSESCDRTLSHKDSHLAPFLTVENSIRKPLFTSGPHIIHPYNPTLHLQTAPLHLFTLVPLYTLALK